ncbi:MAG: CHASE2 domain-containing protein [Phycisphaeraceae bacterium]
MARQRGTWRPDRWGLSLVIGLLLSIAAAGATWAGWLEPLERPLLDWRLRHFQFASPAPSTRIVHIDIGDETLAKFGRWPWPRAHLAGIVDELARAGAKVMAFDVLFFEPQPTRYVPQRVPVPLVEQDAGESSGDGDDSYYLVDDDAVFASAIQRAGNVLLPVVTNADRDRSTTASLDPSLRALRGSTHAPALSLSERSIQAPIAKLATMAAGTGFVDYEASPDGIVRSLALWRQARGRLYPLLGLKVACDLLDVDLRAVRITDTATILPAARLPTGEVRDIHVPHLPRHRAPAPSEGRAMLPWSGWVLPRQSADDDGARDTQPRSVRGWQILELHRMRQQRDVLILRLASALNLAPSAEEYVQVLRELRTSALTREQHARRTRQRKELIDSILETAQSYHADFARFSDLSEEEAALRDRLASDLAQHESLHERIEQTEQQLQQRIAGRACLIGLPATGLSDLVPTPLSDQTPGVRIHGALANAILTGHFIRRPPPWIDVLLVLTVGLVITVLSARLAPLLALFATIALLAAFSLFNGLVLLDFGDRWIDLAGPIVAAGVVWSGVMLFRLITEQRTKARITRQFKSYVSQDLVDYLVEHPNLVSLAGQRREMTCLFADLAGFTELSERLGPEQSVKLLNNVLGTVARQMMQHRGLVNKFLGDGIMAFWSAPVENPTHAQDACHAALAATKALRSLDLSDLPLDDHALTLRIGITSGPMMVGDFGAPPDRSDYTVLGDTVNLASRLEAANKQLGTHVLISQRTCEQVKDVFLTRPIGRLVVVGRAAPEPVYELLDTHEEATEAQRALAQATAEAVEAYQAGDFETCMARFNALAAQHEAGALAKLYHEACAAHVDHDGEVTTFDGSLVLAHK